MLYIYTINHTEKPLLSQLNACDDEIHPKKMVGLTLGTADEW